TPSDAAVAVTRGSLDRFSRDELQAVIAHEFSHILNGDMRLNIRLMGWLFGILVLTIVGRKILHSTRYSRGGRDRGSALAIGLALVIVGYIGVFFGHLIKAAVSRSREILADASAVQFTRNSSALAGALKKIAGVPAGGLLQDPEVEEVSHMLFAQGLRARLFATHPPLFERISALEPGFNARAFATESAALAERFDGIPVANLAGNPAGDAAFASTSTQPTGALQDATPCVAVSSFDYQAPSADPTELLASIGALREHPLRMARQLRDAIPESLLRPAHSPGGAVPVLLGLLLDADAHIQARQRAGIVRHLGEAIAAQALRVYPDCARLHPLQRSPLAAIALPAVRRLPLQQLCGLRDVVPELIHADAHVDIHEYVIGAMLEAQLDDALHPGRAQVDPRLTLPALANDVGRLLAVMAHAGHVSSHARKMALSAGQARLPPDARIDVALDDWHLHLDGSLRRLDTLSPARKQVLVEALMATMQHDHHINAREYELLRAVCAALHCPLPALGLAVG
ncbi:MAG: M48 family metalloprotease, partial [Oceanococcaceae bacterium]